MKRKIQQAIAAFAVTGILVLGACGFAVVDVSTQRYMPAGAGSLFRVTESSSEGMRFFVLGEEYHLSAEPVQKLVEKIWPYRGLLPHSITMTAYLVAKIQLMWVHE